MSEIRVRFHLSWVNGGFIRTFARGFVRIDGEEHPAAWRGITTIDVPPGEHRVEAYLRYKGFRANLGLAARSIDLLDSDASADVTVFGSSYNHVPFTIRAARPSGSGSHGRS